MSEGKSRVSSIPVAIFAIVLIFGAFLAGGVLVTETNAGQQSSSGVNTLAGYNVTQEFSAVWGLNSSAHTWYAATVTHTGPKLSIVFPAHKVINEIIIQTKNGSQNAYDLAALNLFFSYQDFTMASGYGNLSDAYMYFGHPVNDSSTTAVTDKGVSYFSYNATLYSASVDQFGQTIQIPVNALQQSDPYTTPQYVFYLHSNSSANLTTGLSVTYSQYWEYTVKQPIVSLDPLSFDAIVGLAMIAITAFISYRWVLPVIFASENQRVNRWQTRRERNFTAVALFIFATELVFTWFLGQFTPLFGMGALFAALPFGAYFVVTYTGQASTQKWSTAVGFMTLGVAVGFGLNIITGFGTIAYNFLISGRALLIIASLGYLFVGLPVMYFGLQNTKREHIKRRYEPKEMEVKAAKPVKR